jgi:hypothetical protein
MKGGKQYWLGKSKMSGGKSTAYPLIRVSSLRPKIRRKVPITIDVSVHPAIRTAALVVSIIRVKARNLAAGRFIAPAEVNMHRISPKARTPKINTYFRMRAALAVS